MRGVPSGILLATRSEGKLRELRPLFADAGFEVTDPSALGISAGADEEALERFDTFEENASAKASYFFGLTGLATVADDSGLEVTALAGKPGVHSKRWSGRADLNGRALDAANNALLLAELGNHADRSARYVCVAAYVDELGSVTRRGEVAGWIRTTPRGTDGFGYDPYFMAAELGRTFAELSRLEKERISHRGIAMRALIGAFRPLRSLGAVDRDPGVE